MTSFPALLQKFFTERLMRQRQASSHTVSSYRDTFRLLLQFAQRRLKKSPCNLTFQEVDAPLIAAFLEDMEERRCVKALDSQSPSHGYPFVLSLCGF